MTRNSGGEGRRNDVEDVGRARAEELNKAGEGILLLLPVCTQHAHENLLSFSAVGGAVAAPGLARDDSGPDGPFGGIVGSIEARAVEKLKYPRLFMGQMVGEADILWRRQLPAEQAVQSVLQVNPAPVAPFFTKGMWENGTSNVARLIVNYKY